MQKERLTQLADMLEAQIRILTDNGYEKEADTARQEVVSLRLLAGVTD